MKELRRKAGAPRSSPTGSLVSSEPVIERDAGDVCFQAEAVSERIFRKDNFRGEERRRGGCQIVAARRDGAEIGIEIFALDAPIAPQSRLDATANCIPGLGVGEGG